MLAIAPGVYIGIAAIVFRMGGRVLARDPNITPILFVAFLTVSIGTVGVTIFLQRRRLVLSESTPYLSLYRVYQKVSLGGVLSEAHSVYGLVITLLSGSITYVIGFSLVSWASLFWVRSRFMDDLRKLPDTGNGQGAYGEP